MELPDLNRIVEAHVPVSSFDLGAYWGQLRKDILLPIRKLQSDGHLRWFSFLLHPAKQLAGFDDNDGTRVFHLRLEPTPTLDVASFIKRLPTHFKNPIHRPLDSISGPDGCLLANGDWAHGWRVVGECSEWVLCFLEAHPGDFTPKQLSQFLHYISNALGLGWQFQHSKLRF